MLNKSVTNLQRARGRDGAGVNTLRTLPPPPSPSVWAVTNLKMAGKVESLVKMADMSQSLKFSRKYYFS